MKIRNTKTGRLYNSIAAAAKAAMLDPSNVGKVLRGQRKTAGGIRFEWVEERSAEDLYEGQLRGVQNALRQANAIIREYKREHVYSLGSAIGELLEMGDIIGLTKSGYLPQNLKSIRAAFPNVTWIPELQQMQNRLYELTQKAERQLQVAIQEKIDLADQFGISVAKMEEYMPLMPEVFQVLKTAGTDPSIGTNLVYEKIENAMQNYVSRGDLRRLLRGIEKWYADPDRDADGLEDVYTNWYRKVLAREAKEKDKKLSGSFKFNP